MKLVYDHTKVTEHSTGVVSLLYNCTCAQNHFFIAIEYS